MSPTVAALPPVPEHAPERAGCSSASATDPELPRVDEEWEPTIPFGHPVELPPFPVEVLPTWVGRYVTDLAQSTQTPSDLASMLALTILATAAARKVDVEVRPGWTEPVNLYVTVAMPPGSRKSPVFARVTAPLMAWEHRALDWARPDISDATARKRIAEDLVRQAEKIAAAADEANRERLTAEAVAVSEAADAILVPNPPRLLADDATVEAVASLLAEQNGRLAILSAEGDLFDIMAGRYSASRTPNFGVFLKGWSGDDLRVDRKGRSPEHVEQPALTLGLAVQPEVLSSISRQPGFRGRGLLARFLYALPPSNVGRRLTNTPPVPEAVEACYAAEMLTLLTTMAELQEPVSLTLAPAAARCFERFEAALEPRLHPDTGDLGHVADWGAKLAGHTARIAGLLHLATHLRDGWSVPIDLETVKAAIAIAEYLVAHAVAAFDLMGADPIIADARAIVDWLERADLESFSRRECHRALASRFSKATDLDPVLTLLEDRGWVRQEPRTRTGPKGGRPTSPRFVVNERWRQNRHNRRNQGDDAGSVGSVGSVGSGSGDRPAHDELPVAASDYDERDFWSTPRADAWMLSNLSNEAAAGDAADPYHCLYCGTPVTPAPASLEHNWSTVCRACSEAGR